MGPPRWGSLSGPPVNALRWCRGKPCLPRGLLAGALGSPAPTAVHPGPSAGILVPMTGSEGRGVGGLDNVFPRLPNVLAAIPDPMTGVPSIAGQGGRYIFCECCRRWGVTTASGDGGGARSSACASNGWALVRSTSETTGTAVELPTEAAPPGISRVNPKAPARIAAAGAGLALTTISDPLLPLPAPQAGSPSALDCQDRDDGHTTKQSCTPYLPACGAILHPVRSTSVG